MTVDRAKHDVHAGLTDTADTGGPLTGLTVLDFSQVVQGPLATQVLGDLGADVVKFERPEGEWLRNWGILASSHHGETDSFLAFNRNKRSVAADLRDPAIRDRILERGAEADVVVENFRPGVMDKLGLGYEDFRAVNPALVYARSSGWGQVGPYRDWPGHDMLVQGVSGMMYLSGRNGDPPMACGAPVVDTVAGLYFALGILAGVMSARATGRGQLVEIDLLGCALAAQQQELTVFLNRDPRAPLARADENVGHVGATAPYGIYEASDGYFGVAMFPCTELAKVLNLPWLSAFETNDDMFRHRDEIYRGLSEYFLGRPRDATLELLRTGGVWCAPVFDYVEMETNEHILEQAPFWDVPIGEESATFRTVGSPFSFSETPAAVRRGVPRLGQDTSAYLGDADRALVD
jgi:crotonobetainyl-CoA:carnitine CoA-transferase CaiB-like acyl-CoA transferase